MSSSRETALATRLGQVRDRLASACAAAGRAVDEVTLIAVTKFFPASDVEILAGLGVRDFGESREAEARAKAAAFPDVRWHFVGGLQRNKCRALARYADVVHSVDRPALADALADAAGRVGRMLDVLVQVNLDPGGTPEAPGRSGVPPSRLPELTDHVASTKNLRLRGLMAVAPRTGDAARAFAEASTLSGHMRTSYPDATWLSAGMSGDLELAIAHGATHVRVGSALLGSRMR